MLNRNLFSLVGVPLLSSVLVSCYETAEMYSADNFKAREAPVIAEYVQGNEALDGAKLDTTTGIWYLVEDAGSGDYPYEKYPYIKAKASGELLDGTIFYQTEEENPLQSNLLGMIEAWKIAFKPKMYGGLLEHGLQKGAKVKMVTPSPYAYRNAMNGLIPANSPLYFSIEVLDISEQDMGQQDTMSQ